MVPLPINTESGGAFKLENDANGSMAAVAPPAGVPREARRRSHCFQLQQKHKIFTAFDHDDMAAITAVSERVHLFFDADVREQRQWVLFQLFLCLL